MWSIVKLLSTCGKTIEIICEGTYEVRENRLEILTLAYEAFKLNPGEEISELFERFNKLINDLNLHEKFYSKKEVNKKVHVKSSYPLGGQDFSH